MYALHRCGLTEQLATSKAMWVTSLISLTFELTSQGENPTPQFYSLRGKFTEEARTTW